MIIRKLIQSKLGVEPLSLRGQTLIEVLVAMGAGVVVLVAMVSVVLSALSNAQFSKNQNLATQYAQQGMEIVRDLKNRTGWASFRDGYSNSCTPSGCSPKFYCLRANGQLAEGRCTNPVDMIDNFFKREAKFMRLITDPDNRIQATVTTSFTDNKGEHKSDLVSIFTNWE